MPIVCALVPAYRAAVARARRPELRGQPLIVVDRLERGHVTGLDPEAFALGARLGMTLVQAASCAREAAVTVDDTVANAALWERFLDALDAASPLVEDAAPGTAFLEMRGIAGSPARLLAGVRAALAELRACACPDAEGRSCTPACTLPLAVAFGPSPFVARAAARAASLSGEPDVVITGDPRAFLAPLSLAELDLDRATIERLELFGVRTLGELAALPHGPFVRRFGAEAARWHARACGVDDRPLVPRPRALRIEGSLFGEGTAEREEQVLFALRTLVRRVADDVAFAGKRCGFMRLHLECEDGETRELAIPLAQPTSVARTIFELLRARLEGIVLAAPVTGLRLGAERLEEGGTMLSLFAGSDPDPEVVAIALERVRAALGEEAAQGARTAPAFRYESAATYATFHAAHVPASRDCAETADVATIAYRVLVPREIAVSLARGTPARVDGRLALDVAGPWRTDERWWTGAFPSDDGAPVVSDVYDVLLDDGALVRIDRVGDRWHLRGTYD